jgi:hypothetical protein
MVDRSRGHVHGAAYVGTFKRRAGYHITACRNLHTVYYIANYPPKLDVKFTFALWIISTLHE